MRSNSHLTSLNHTNTKGDQRIIQPHMYNPDAALKKVK